jgi:hypothetical protein
MNYAENPITDLANCIAHAQYVGFSSIEYERMDYDAVRNARTDEEKRASMSATVKALRRPTTRDFGVYNFFDQTWGSTSLGHGGMGGAAVTTAYTTVLYCYATQEFLVYFGGSYCYTIKGRNEAFLEDCKNRCVAGKREAKTKYGIVERD